RVTGLEGLEPAQRRLQARGRDLGEQLRDAGIGLRRGRGEGGKEEESAGEGETRSSHREGECIVRAVPFAYYDRLSRRERAIYDRSDAVTRVVLPAPDPLRPMVDVLRQGLARDQRKVVEAASQMLVRAITESLGVEPVDVGVLAVRPTLREAELHGLYTREPGRRARIRVWMRTVRYKRVVAFRTFLRTLLHEACHH